jgi:hypothetical protein
MNASMVSIYAKDAIDHGRHGYGSNEENLSFYDGIQFHLIAKASTAHDDRRDRAHSKGSEILLEATGFR